jgi:Inhibitor of Apoptosis domain
VWQPLAPALSAIEGVARTISLDSKHPANDAAKHLLSCLSAVNQLSGWQHVQNYIQNPQLYVERLKSAQRGEEPTRGPVVPGSMDDFQFRGQTIIKRLCQRIEWLLDLQRKSNKPFDAEFAVKVVAADREWANDANVFMKEAESKVTDMLTKNQQKFQAFRELQRKGVQWPHSPELRREIEAAGFVFRPMMIKRDRCVCETCGVEVSGWRPWHNPWSFHNYAKHPVTFQPQVRNLLQPPTSAAVSQMVTEANRRKAANAAAAANNEALAAASAANNQIIAAAAAAAATAGGPLTRPAQATVGTALSAAVGAVAGAVGGTGADAGGGGGGGGGGGSNAMSDP